MYLMVCVSFCRRPGGEEKKCAVALNLDCRRTCFELEFAVGVCVWSVRAALQGRRWLRRRLLSGSGAGRWAPGTAGEGKCVIGSGNERVAAHTDY